MRIVQGDHVATFTPGVGYASENESFALWLSTTFPASTYPSAVEHKADLLAHGCAVDGTKPIADPVPDAPEPVEEPTPVNPHEYAGVTVATTEPVAEPHEHEDEIHL